MIDLKVPSDGLFVENAALSSARFIFSARTEFLAVRSRFSPHRFTGVTHTHRESQRSG